MQKCDKEIAQYLDHIVDTQSPSVIKAFEKRIDSLEQDKLVLVEKMEDSGHPVKPYQQMYRTAMQYLCKPYKLWNEGGYEGKRTVLKLTFTKHLIWERSGMYRTPELSLPFKVLDGFLNLGKIMVRVARLELARPYGQQILSLQRLPFRHTRASHDVLL